MSFGRWRQQLGVMLAVKWLAGGASIQQVAADLGYESVPSFVTMFRKSARHLAWPLHGRATFGPACRLPSWMTYAYTPWPGERDRATIIAIRFKHAPKFRLKLCRRCISHEIAFNRGMEHRMT